MCSVQIKSVAMFSLRVKRPAAFIFNLTSTVTWALCYWSLKQDIKSRYKYSQSEDEILSWDFKLRWLVSLRICLWWSVLQNLLSEHLIMSKLLWQTTKTTWLCITVKSELLFLYLSIWLLISLSASHLRWWSHQLQFWVTVWQRFLTVKWVRLSISVMSKIQIKSTLSNVLVTQHTQLLQKSNSLSST